jgi:hypothetical protein
LPAGGHWRYSYSYCPLRLPTTVGEPSASRRFASVVSKSPNPTCQDEPPGALSVALHLGVWCLHHVAHRQRHRCQVVPALPTSKEGTPLFKNVQNWTTLKDVKSLIALASSRVLAAAGSECVRRCRCRCEGGRMCVKGARGEKKREKRNRD